MNGKKRKIGVIGIGNVGAHVASSLIAQGSCEELVLIDCDMKKAAAHAADLADSLPYMPHDVQVYSGDFRDIGDADILVMSAAGDILKKDRLLELETAMDIVDEIAPKVEASGFQGMILNISNPCDLVAQYLQKKTGLCVIGTGTMLDSARAQMLVARRAGVSPSSVRGFVLGEHGDSQMVWWSQFFIGNMTIAQWMEQFGEFDLKQIAVEAAHEGWDIVQGKGCTEFGVAAACAALVRAVLCDEKRILPVSVYVEEEGIYTSVPCIVGKGGAEKRLPLLFNESEKQAFQNSCGVLKKHAAKLR